MDGSELKTFIQKFQQLWQSGLSAHLDLDTHAGQAWVGLRVRLGQAPGPPHKVASPFHQRSRSTPSRQRRRARRDAERQEKKAEEAVNLVVEETETGTEAEEAEPESNNDEIDSAAIADVLDTHEEIHAVEDVPEPEEPAPALNIIDDELCPDEEFYEEIDANIAFTCIQCHIEHFPASYVPGDRIAKYGLCRWHLGVSQCKKCDRKIVGLGTIRVHRQTCHAPS